MHDEEWTPVQKLATIAALDLILWALIIAIFVAGSAVLGYAWEMWL